MPQQQAHRVGPHKKSTKLQQKQKKMINRRKRLQQQKKKEAAATKTHDNRTQEEQPAAAVHREAAVTMRNDYMDTETRKNQKDEEFRALIEEQRMTDEREKERLKNVNKEIKQRIRDNKRSKRQEKIPQIPNNSKGSRVLQKKNNERPAADEEKPKEEKLHCVTDEETEEGSKQS